MAEARGIASRRSVLVHAAVATPALFGWGARLPGGGAADQTGPRIDERARVLNDTDARDIQDVIDSARPHEIVAVTRNWNRTTSVLIDRPITLTFDGGSLSTDIDIDLIVIRASGVRIVNAVLSGAGGDHSGLGRGIRALGTVERPIQNLTVTRAAIERFAHDGVLLEHCTNFEVVDSRITDMGYAGVLMFSCADGLVARNTIERVTQPAPYPNSYGIEVVRSTSVGLDRAPRSTRIVVSDNHVSDVPFWEGIDTHGGEAIAILRNRVERCRVGIAVVPSKDEGNSDATKYAPLRCSIVENLVVRDDPGPGSGIVIRGAGESVGSSAERATGEVLRNTIVGYGDGDRDGAILAYLTRGLVIAQNECRGGRRRAISLYHSNAEMTVRDNVIAALEQQGTAPSVAVDVRSTDNDVIVIGNSHRTGAVLTPAYGLMCRQAGNDCFLIGNDWSGTAPAVVAAPDVVVRHRE